MCSDLRFERTENLELVRRILTHPRIWPHISDDGSPPPEQFEPPDHPAIWHVLAWDGDELLGLWLLVPHNSVCWEVHTALLPHAWGERARRAARAFLAWLWRETPCRRLITAVPASNRLALRFAEAAGMRIWGVNEKSFLRGGRLEDQILLGLSPPEKE
jgi:RimJ/RimL family protein N-acetyltransferase